MTAKNICERLSPISFCEFFIRVSLVVRIVLSVSLCVSLCLFVFSLTTITELILTNIISKYDAHLIPYPNKPKNHHLKIISHNAIETKTKFGSPDLPHSHGIWGIHKSLIQKWNSPSFHKRILNKGFFIYEDQKFPLRKVIHSPKEISSQRKRDG